jgi:hypothetical protein
MKLSQIEVVVVVLLIAYIAFFSHPPPSHIRDFLSSPVGHAVFLLGIVYLVVYKSLIIGIFAGIAYVMTAANTTEYLDEKEQKPKADAKLPTSSGVPASTSSLKDILGKLEKGDTLAHGAVAGKTVTAPPPPTSTPKPATASGTTTKTSTPL